ncbi:metallophosphoesterase [Candidimonas sp. SYP-B2681]|uniref:metallophosphoesterase n=1 Tax=Candidimonas sp. SYP-B2681 TaxID=2497686 RepID=UPI000F88AC63|nr:metallophosphoesterase [Candidimonas sp. SYP-B2681]RTZ47454.1 metallophosphoesterase [Candidimonas sp. SYP-B2681]
MRRFSFFLRLPVIVFLAHAYVGIRLAGAVESLPGRVVTLGGLLIVYLLIMAGFAARRTTGTPWGDAIAWIGFLFLGLFSWLFITTLLRDVVLLIAVGIHAMSPLSVTDHSVAQLEWQTALAVPLISLLAVLLGLFNARRLPKIADVRVQIAGLPAGLNGFTIVQITDLHVGPTIKRGYVAAVVKAANALSADIVVLTGDLVDGDVETLQEHTLPLSDLRATLGVYAVTGNHEYYSGAAQWVAEYQRLGMQMLINQHKTLQYHGERLVLAGVSDFGAGHFDSAQTSDPKLALHGAPVDAAIKKILLAHQPRSANAAAAAGFDLQISGHTHGGQFWPWGYFVPLQQPFVAGLHRLDSLQVYVSRGTGYWGPPMRIGARSEISRIRLSAATSL